ncbi:hypothetical protein TELCIR_23481 [Teladorsagia circumcincta]|uniref:Uncharacterized protein n=1 Tax=Teladorsagia circumcincta TaxID=45464 RepID=A0A2G9TAY1_TELCI|nr:hypothetical protein TELCIR_23481 [Teladorsagia circumcincta]
MTSTSDVRQGIKFTTRHFRVAAEAEKEINKMLRVSREASVKPSLLCLLIDEEPRVMRAGHVLWASPSSRPDLGGKVT